jgi:hypothetical protein
MTLPPIERDWEVFIAEGTPGIGAVRQVAPDHITVYIEGFGDVTVHAPQIVSVHDGKVIVDPDSFPDNVRTAMRHAHDREPR